jgi:hypothetical protein
MRQRCSNPKLWDYKYYGGRGIIVCERWDDPVLFCADMGKRPSKQHQIDRKDNSLGYSPENCRWVLRPPQMRNTSISKYWVVYGVVYQSLHEASTALGVSVGRVKAWCDGRTDGGYIYPPKPNCWSEKKYARDI